METFGIRTVPLARLRMPGDFKKRLASAEAELRARSIETIGVLHEPMVRQRDWLVVSEIDAVAAHFLLERTKINVKLIECTDDEIEIIRAHEKRQVRFDILPGPKAQEVIARVEQVLVDSPPPPRPSKKGGKPKTARGQARDIVAAELGVLPGSLRVKEWRLKKRGAKNGVSVDAVPLPRPAVCAIRTLGMQPSQEFVEEMSKLERLLHSARTHVSAAIGDLTRITKLGLAFPSPRLQQMQRDLKVCSTQLVGAQPSCICPFCKGMDALQANCGGCFGGGFITESQLPGVPRALLDEAQPKVMVDGQLRNASDFEEDPWP